MDFKDSSLSHVGRCDLTLQMMSNCQQNMRMFIWDRTGGFGRKMEGVAESENGRKRGRLYGHIWKIRLISQWLATNWKRGVAKMATLLSEHF